MSLIRPDPSREDRVSCYVYRDHDRGCRDCSGQQIRCRRARALQAVTRLRNRSVFLHIRTPTAQNGSFLLKSRRLFLFSALPSPTQPWRITLTRFKLSLLFSFSCQEVLFVQSLDQGRASQDLASKSKKWPGDRGARESRASLCVL